MVVVFLNHSLSGIHFYSMVDLRAIDAGIEHTAFSLRSLSAVNSTTSAHSDKSPKYKQYCHSKYLKLGQLGVSI